jgi:5-methylcytosine-specific restriction endonuclease McrA
VRDDLRSLLSPFVRQSSARTPAYIEIMESERALHATSTALHCVSDDELLRRLGELVSHSRRVEADLVAHIGEVDERRLYAREASPSMFSYCTERLHLSEAEAYRRITVARAARKHEVLLAMLRDGRLHLSGIAMLAPLLTPENRDALLARATHRSKRQIEELVVELSPRPDAPSLMRKLPDSPKGLLPGAPQGRFQGRLGARELVPGRVDAPSPSRPAVMEPLSPARYKVQFTASAELRDKLERLSALMRSEVPDGDLAAVIERAVSETLERREARRYAQTRAPRKRLADTDTSPVSRHIPAAVRRAVRERDGDRCGYVDEQGRRCSAKDRLEFHHRHPFGMGGDHSPGNLMLVCSVHNRCLAEHDYGQAVVNRRRRLEKEASSDLQKELSRPASLPAVVSIGDV